MARSGFRFAGIERGVYAGLVLGALFAPAIAQDAAPAPDRPAKEKKTTVKNPFPNRVLAADLEGGVEWLNTSGEISLKDLRGKVVLLDFWTFCCINCIHVLPDLEYLEKKYEKELVVIGVHSAKFDNEKETGNIRKAILRYEISHPVVNDAKMTIWRKFGVNSWPTLVLIDPEGYYCGFVSGEGNRELLDEVIAKVIEYHRSKGTLDQSPVSFDLERHQQAPTPLRFPGKLLVDARENRLFVSDSNHNRIVVAALDGKLIDVIGTGEIGAADGPYDKAQFDHPQGICLVENTLYVADTENHLIRAVDLAAKNVTTLAGDGKQGHFRARGGKLRQSSLNSPWDLCVVNGVMYIAMAGPHQIWSHQLGSNTIQPYAGSGREDIRNGALAEAALAQPSGITSDGSSLFVVDSEGSSVRRISTRPNQSLKDPQGVVETIVGTSDLPNGRALFEFGDVDGIGDMARLQHPLGIVFAGGTLFVADSYNHKIKVVDPVARTIQTWAGTGKPGARLNPVEFAEPAGLAIAGETLYVADTNNHRIVAIHVPTKQASEFTIAGLTPPRSVTNGAATDDAEKDEPVSDVARQAVKSGEQMKVEVAVTLPEGYKLNEQGPVKYLLEAVGSQSLFSAEHLGKRTAAKIQGDKVMFEVPLAATSGEATLKLTLTYGYCRGGSSGLCKLATHRWKIPLEVSAGAPTDTVALSAAP
jgi:thiol-disulfide isomerase/thioredoxin